MTKLRITHLSDWHGVKPKRPLPKADLYICTGDMLGDFRSKDGSLDIFRTRALQSRFILQNPFREWLPKESRDAPVLVVRGNHDWINLSPWFGDQVFEIGRADTYYQLFDFVFAGFRGVSRINGEWSDELDVDGGREVVDRIGKSANGFDFLVTHSPPLGIMDSFARRNGGVERAGLQSITNLVNRQLMSGAAGTLIGHFFGHIHEQYGFKALPTYGEQALPLKTIGFSNAATGYLSYVVLPSSSGVGHQISLTHEVGRLFT